MERTRTTARVSPLAAVALGILVQVPSARAQSPDAAAERQRAVEAGLLPAVVVAGDPEPSHTIHERMAHHGVPGVSIAVINDGHVEWAEGYGVKRAGGADSVVVSTLFQAASISKPVAAAGVLRLVERGRLDLDDDIEDRLRSWRLPENAYTAERPVTLRGILTHTAGLTIHGFPGYASGETVPTAVDVLDGAGNTDPVRVDTIPGALFRYSGGGYTVAQVLVEDVTGDSFAAVLERAVLEPLGMRRSTYAQPLPERLAEDAAVAHRADGSPVDGRWHTYPERAAAGLWTTPTDLARFALGIRAAYLGEPGALLERATVREMLSEHMGGRGLGPSVAGTGDGLRFSHGGANAGYRAYFVLYPATGDGVAVMTNADTGGMLYGEVLRAVARVYGWPDYRPETRTVVEVDPATLDGYVGEYEVTDDVVITITREGERFFARPTNGAKRRLLAESATEFLSESDDVRLTFVRGADGRATHLILHVGGREMEARRLPLVQDPGAGPPSELNPDRAHVEVFLRDAPAIELYDRRDLSGDARIRLNERGFFVGDELVCSWPGGHYDPGNAANMVLGYMKRSPAGSPVAYRGCPPGLPVISTWADDGHGVATLYIEVFSRDGPVVETRYGAESHYLDLNDLPGDPRNAVPSLDGPPDGYVGWDWHASEKEEERREGTAAGRLLERPAFSRFLRDVRACLTSVDAPACFASFVRPEFYHPDAARSVGASYYVTPEQFVGYAWEAPHPRDDGRRLWSALAACFTRARMTGAQESTARFETEDGFVCDVGAGPNGWRLTHFMSAP